MGKHEATHALLTRLGYQSKTRVTTLRDGSSAARHEVQALLQRGDEAWLGVGNDDEAAFEDALHKAFPSSAARQLLELELARMAAAGAVRAEHDAADGPSQRTGSSHGTATDNAARPRAQRTVLEVFRVNPTRTTGANAPRKNAITFHPPPPPRAARVRPAAPEKRPAAPSAADSEAALHKSADEVALWSTTWQRHWLVAQATRARAEAGDSVPTEALLHLGRLARSWWPGFVAILREDAAPEDIGKDVRQPRRTPPEPPPSTWAGAATAAAESLAQRRADDIAEGADAYGWFDRDALVPAPSAPARLLADLVTTLEAGGEPLSDRTTAGQASLETAQLVRAVRRLRWLRGAPLDDALWASVAGRLRFLIGRIKTPDNDARRALEANYVPDSPWAELANQVLLPGLHAGHGSARVRSLARSR